MIREQKAIRRLYKDFQKAPLQKFPARVREKLHVPDVHGIYAILNRSGKVLHVGRTVRGKRGLHQRLRNHLCGASSFHIKWIKPRRLNLRRGYQFRFLFVESSRERALLEAYAIGVLCPAHIGEGALLNDQ
ncbi:MAG: hypothetical protein ACR2K5_05860 [Pseudolabrys sp.]